MIDRSYPGFLDLCWPEDTATLRRLQLGTSPCWRLSYSLCSRQHWSRCPELYLQIGRIRLNILWPAGLLPQWHPTVQWVKYFV